MKKYFFIFSLLFFGFLFFNISSAHAATLYYNAGTDTDWNTSANWWTDPIFFTPGSVPTVSDDAIVSGNVDVNGGSPASVNTMTVNGTAYTAIAVTVANGATFNDSSYNLNTISGDATFNNLSSNNSIVSGDATFNDSSFNSGTVSVNATFNDSGINYGTVSGNATFNDLSFNNGIVSGDAIFNYASGGIITLNGDQTWSTIGGTSKGNDNVLITEFIFNDSTFSQDTIPGNATFNGSSNNFSGSTITGNATFNDSSFNSGTVSGNATFNDSSKNDSIVSGDATFNDLSHNNKNVFGNAIFNNTSWNDGTCGFSIVFVPCNGLGTISGNAIFNDSSYNDFNINGNAIFNDSSYNTRSVVGNATFNDSSHNDNTIFGDATFYDSSYNDFTINGNAIFNDLSYNDPTGTVAGSVGSPNAFFYDSTDNQGNVTNDACFATTATDSNPVGIGGATTVCAVSLPVVTTTSSTVLTTSSADLFGAITNTGGESANTVGFQYYAQNSNNTTYSDTISTAGSFVRQTFDKIATSLSVCGIYHYRAFATNSAGTGYGGDLTFNTTTCHTSAGGGGSTTPPPVIPPIVPTTIPPVTPPITICASGNLFSTTTGLPCTSFNQPNPPAISNPININRTLRLGVTVGDDIKTLQIYLNTHGYPLANTGPGSLSHETNKFGVLTYNAVIKFQKANNLVPDGIVGPKTLAMLNSHI